jgi:hypothetical protein
MPTTNQFKPRWKSQFQNTSGKRLRKWTHPTSADSARKTNCNDIPRDVLPVFFPHQLQCQIAMLLQLLMNAVPVRLRTTLPEGWSEEELEAKLFGNQAVPIPAVKQSSGWQ